MPSTTATTVTSSAAASTCHAKLYETPSTGAACAMRMDSTHHALMTDCCGSASITSYSDCNYYCLAQNQAVGDLAQCLIEGSAAGQVWCNTNANAMATGTATATASEPTSVTASAMENEESRTAGLNTTEAMGLDIQSVLLLVLVMLGGLAQPLA